MFNAANDASRKQAGSYAMMRTNDIQGDICFDGIYFHKIHPIIF